MGTAGDYGTGSDDAERVAPMKELLERLEEGKDEIDNVMALMSGSGRYDRPSMTYTRVEAKKVKRGKPGNDAFRKISGTLVLGPKKGVEGGVYFRIPYKGADYVKNHKRDAVNAMSHWVGKNRRAVEADVHKWVKGQSWKWTYEFLDGWRDRDEWEIDEDSIKLGTMKYGDPVMLDRLGVISMPVMVNVEFKAKKKASVGKGMLSDMDDGQLDALIWEYEGPENIYMDGEMDYPIEQRMRELRKQYRAMTPRQQGKVWDEHIKIMRGGYR